MEYIKKLYLLLDVKTKKKFGWLVALSIFVSVIEAIGISAIMPFVDIATNFESIHNNQYYKTIFIFFGFRSEVNFAIVFGLALVVFYIFRGLLNLWYSYVMAHFTQGLYSLTTKKLFKTYLAMPYKVFAKRNSSYMTKAIITEASLMSNIINSVLLMISEAFVIVFLYVLMLLANWEITLIFSIVLVIKVIFLTLTVSKKIKIMGVTRAKVQANYYEIVNRLFGNFKHIKLQDENRIRDIEGNFKVMVDRYAKANAMNGFFNDFPRLFLETSGFSLIILLLIILLYVENSDVSYILPTLSLFVLALYRLLPSVNRIANSYNVLMYYHRSIDIVSQELIIEQENLSNKEIKFESRIELKNVNFSFQDRLVLKNVSLVLKKGERVAFIGESGSGKSTLVDLIIGLYHPNHGEIRVDNKLLNESNLQSWRSQIGYIPQQVYLFDGTIQDNVCFGRETNEALLKKVLIQANIFNFLQTKQGVSTLVGEGGIQLSGGQKQRIAIARALYGEPEILALDEATSSLDDNTEKKIMDEIYQISQGKTLIVIAHRLSTIRNCDKVYKVKDSALVLLDKMFVK